MKILLLFTPLALFVLVNSCSSDKSAEVIRKHLYNESQSLDDHITINPGAVENLKFLQKAQKFGPEKQTDQLPLGYVGFLPPENRPLANRTLNQSISKLILVLQKNKHVTKRMILNEFEKGLNAFNELAIDTEDRERLCYYYEDIMDFIGLESTNELLNNWMYQ